MDSYRPSENPKRSQIYHFGSGNNNNNNRGRARARGFDFRPPTDSLRRPRDHAPHKNSPIKRSRNKRLKNAADTGVQVPKQSFAEAMERAQHSGRAKSERLHAKRPYNKRGGGQSTSTRPLLSGQRAPTPELLQLGLEAPAKFKNVNELSDSDEAEMDMDSDTPETSEPPLKKIALQPANASLQHQERPRWSNPDPYTSLPPPDESQAKKKDVVNLIRKARASETGKDSPHVVESDDFISFSFDEVYTESVEQTPGRIVERTSMPSRFKSDRNSSSDIFARAPGAANISAGADSLGPPPAPSRVVLEALNMSRKRTYDSFVDLETHSDDEPPGRVHMKTDPKRKILPVPCGPWQKSLASNPTPWIIAEDQKSPDLRERFHDEINEFYGYLRPSESEHKLRRRIVDRIQYFVDRFYPNFDNQVFYFGSFACGTYLPTGDMDLVIISERFNDRGQPHFMREKRHLYGFRNTLVPTKIPRNGIVDVIAHARVPLVKFVDSTTGLQIDISFENSSGIAATQVYNDWVAQFPTLPVIVMLVKQLLLMHDLNEVRDGGLGSFSVTCLVASFLQHRPRFQQQMDRGEENLGEILMAFLDFYGNEFDYQSTAIQMSPPKYIPNSRNPARMVIIDPNRPENNISDGTRKIGEVLKLFAMAHRALRNQLEEFEDADDMPEHLSLLAPVFAGNYYSYENQRRTFRRLTEV